VNIKTLIQSDKYDLVSFRENSVPGVGSPCRDVKGLKPDIPVKRTIKHRTGDITVVTPFGYIRFWHIRNREWAKTYDPSRL